jgi:hypothetical protein
VGDPARTGFRYEGDSTAAIPFEIRRRVARDGWASVRRRGGRNEDIREGLRCLWGADWRARGYAGRGCGARTYSHSSKEGGSADCGVHYITDDLIRLAFGTPGGLRRPRLRGPRRSAMNLGKRSSGPLCTIACRACATDGPLRSVGHHRGGLEFTSTHFAGAAIFPLAIPSASSGCEKSALAKAVTSESATLSKGLRAVRFAVVGKRARW